MPLESVVISVVEMALKMFGRKILFALLEISIRLIFLKNFNISQFKIHSLFICY